MVLYTNRIYVLTGFLGRSGFHGAHPGRGTGVAARGPDAFGNLISTTAPSGNVTTVGYDVRRRQTAVSDPDRGTWSFSCNGFNDLRVRSGHHPCERMQERDADNAKKTAHPANSARSAIPEKYVAFLLCGDILAQAVLFRYIGY